MKSLRPSYAAPPKESNRLVRFYVPDCMAITRGHFLLSLAGIHILGAQDRPAMHIFERRDFTIDDFPASGYVLDIGGGGEGIIGLMKPSQAVAIDLSKRELEESPSGPLKIVMDATDLKFLDSTFETVTAFFSLMYMRPKIQAKVFAETLRVLKPGGRWLIWDVAIPTALEKDSEGPAFRFRFHLPNRKDPIETGYGTLWPDKPMDLGYYVDLARRTGFEVAVATEVPGAFRILTIELRRPRK